MSQCRRESRLDILKGKEPDGEHKTSVIHLSILEFLLVSVGSLVS